MKALYLAPPLESDGRALAYTFLDEEARALQAAGIQLYVIATYGKDRVEGGIQVRVLPKGRIGDRLATVPFLLRHRAAFPLGASARDWYRAYHFSRIERFVAGLVREEDIALIHSHFAWPGGLGGAIAAAETGRPLITCFRGMDLNLAPELGYGMRLDPFYEHAIHYLVRQADRTTYISDYLRRIGVSIGAEPARAVTIRKGVDLDRFAPVADRAGLRSRLGIESPMILAVCGLKKLKGLHHVLQALALVRKTHDFRFVVIGEGKELQHLEQQARELGLEDRVQFLGTRGRDEVPAYFAACDVFILASLIEGAGNVLLEAMASGRPAICTDSGGPPEYVQHDRTGFVVPVGDVTAMAERIRTLLDDPELADRFGRAGRALMVERFGFPRMIDQIISLYQDVAGA